MINCFCLYGDCENYENITPEVVQRRAKGVIAKTTFFVIGLLLAATALFLHLRQLNATAVYSMGGVGGALMLGTLIASCVHCISMRRDMEARHESRETAERVQRENDQLFENLGKWAQAGKREEIKKALGENPIPVHSYMHFEA